MVVYTLRNYITYNLYIIYIIAVNRPVRHTSINDTRNLMENTILSTIQQSTLYYSEICVGTEIYISAVHKQQILFIRGYDVLGVQVCVPCGLIRMQTNTFY